MTAETFFILMIFFAKVIFWLVVMVISTPVFMYLEDLFKRAHNQWEIRRRLKALKGQG